MDDAAFVDFLYRFVLRREADPKGRAYWSGQIAAGMDPMEALRAFIASREFRARREPHPELRLPPPAPPPPRAPTGIYFMHIEKTAGMSVWRWLDDAMGPDVVCPYWSYDQLLRLEAGELSRYNVFRGHFQGWLADFLQRPLRLLTVLREPVARTISFYEHIRRDPTTPLHALAKSLDLAAFCMHPDARHLIEDWQASCLLTTLRTPRDYYADLSGADFWENPLRWRSHHLFGMNVSAKDRLRLASFALDRLAAVGVTEDLAGTLTCFAKVLEIEPPVALPRENRNTDGVCARVDIETVEVIRSLTLVDREIHRLAHERLRNELVATTD